MAEQSVLEPYRFLSVVDKPITEMSLLRKSLLFAEFSKLSYFPEIFTRTTLDELGGWEAEFVDNDGAQAYLFRNETDCVVACRGTEPHDWRDVQADVNAITVVAETAGRVHRGFKEEVDHLWPVIERHLRENEKTLWFTGHSLGGAMATVSAGRCKLSPIPSNPAGLYTYGSPRVGDKRYINFIKLEHIRWVNNNDIVARIPPRWMGYTHAGQEMYLNSYGKLRRMSPLRRIRDRWRGFLTSLLKWKIDHLADHSMNEYIKNIHDAVIEMETRIGRIASRTENPASVILKVDPSLKV